MPQRLAASAESSLICWDGMHFTHGRFHEQPAKTIPRSACLGFFGAGKSTQTGKAILKLQLNLPKAKVLYSSATGASEPNNLAYMIRLGCCGFKDMSELVSELNGCATLHFHILAPGASCFYVILGERCQAHK